MAHSIGGMQSRGAAFARANYREFVNPAPELPAGRFFDAADRGRAGPGLRELRDLHESPGPAGRSRGAIP